MRILVVDDHQLFLDGLRYILPRLDAQIDISEVTDAASALKRIRSGEDFDLVLMDLHMPGLGGVPLLHLMIELGNGLPVVVISGETDTAKIRACLDAGALGFIPKSYGTEKMLAALRQVLKGEVYVPAGIDPDRRPAADAGPDLRRDGITKRQLEVLGLLAAGYSNRKIADTLYISEHTVKAHISALFKTLGAGNRTECVRVAEDRGLLVDRV